MPRNAILPFMHPAMQALIPKSSCTPPRGATRVMQSTKGAKAARWRLNQLDPRCLAVRFF